MTRTQVRASVGEAEAWIDQREAEGPREQETRALVGHAYTHLDQPGPMPACPDLADLVARFPGDAYREVA